MFSLRLRAELDASVKYQNYHSRTVSGFKPHPGVGAEGVQVEMFKPVLQDSRMGVWYVLL